MYSRAVLRRFSDPLGLRLFTCSQPPHAVTRFPSFGRHAHTVGGAHAARAQMVEPNPPGERQLGEARLVVRWVPEVPVPLRERRAGGPLHRRLHLGHVQHVESCRPYVEPLGVDDKGSKVGAEALGVAGRERRDYLVNLRRGSVCQPTHGESPPAARGGALLPSARRRSPCAAARRSNWRACPRGTCSGSSFGRLRSLLSVRSLSYMCGIHAPLLSGMTRALRLAVEPSVDPWSNTNMSEGRKCWV